MILILLISIILTIFSYSDRLFTSYPLNYWLNQFPKSQIVIGDKAPYFFSDSELYAIVGYKYLHGDLPTNLHPEVPPLGKMLIGTSIFIFRNENIVSLLFAICNLILLFIIGRLIGLPKNWSYLALILLCFDYQFWDLATSSMLDTFLLSFLLLAFLSFYRRWFWITSLFLGFMAATKLYLTSLLAVGILILAVLFAGSFKKFLLLMLSLFLYAVGFMLPYITSFVSGLSILDFVRFQRWLTSWWAGNSKIPIGGILTIIFQNRWHTWWGSRAIISAPGWSILWPVSAILAYLSPLKLIKSQNILLLITELWVFGYLIFISITSPFPRYLVLLFPFWLLLALKLIYETFVKSSCFLRRS